MHVIVHILSQTVLQSDFALVENDGVVPLPAQEMKRGGKTKKKKKKLRSIVKLAEVTSAPV